MPQPNVTKITIQAYSDAKLQSPVGQPFTIPVNPEQYSEKRQLKYDTKKGIGQQGTNAKFGATEPEELKLDFIFDNTGAVEGNMLQGTKVSKQVEDFLKTVYTMDGDIHKPRFLKLAWGQQLVFPCVLVSLEVNYTLFSKEGDALRAKVSASFLNHLAEEKRLQLEDKSSPDLTHIRTVVASDRLDNLTNGIYGDPKYLVQVARANGMTSFRRLKTGDKIEFPPFAKQEN